MKPSFPGHLGWLLSQLLLLICILSLGMQGQKIKVEYDKNLDFSKFKTFAWGHHDAVSRPMLALAILGAIEEELTKRGLRKVENNPDIFVQVYGSVDSDMNVVYSDPLYSGMGGIPSFDTGFVMWGSMPGGTTAVTVHKGQLVVDVIDASEKKLAWRGEATEKLSNEKLKLVDQVNSAVEKMFKRYPMGK
ncbi:MAG: DUF4136 domain-containing protein [Candidatus Korobacteraceae bacterium]|jgi:hypothetical protein